MKRQFVSQLRGDTCYPTFRTFVGVATAFGWLAACAAPVIGIMSGNENALYLGIGIGIAIFLVVAIAREATLMLADIADAALDSAWRASEAQEDEPAAFVPSADLAAIAGGVRR